MRRLPSYDDDTEEITANHQHAHFNVNVTVPNPHPSQPDLKVETETEVSLGPFKARGVPKWGLGLGAIAAAVIAALLTKLLG